MCPFWYLHKSSQRNHACFSFRISQNLKKALNPFIGKTLRKSWIALCGCPLSHRARNASYSCSNIKPETKMRKGIFSMGLCAITRLLMNPFQFSHTWTIGHLKDLYHVYNGATILFIIICDVNHNRFWASLCPHKNGPRKKYLMGKSVAHSMQSCKTLLLS